MVAVLKLAWSGRLLQTTTDLGSDLESRVPVVNWRLSTGKSILSESEPDWWASLTLLAVDSESVKPKRCKRCSSEVHMYCIYSPIDGIPVHSCPPDAR